MAIGKLAEIAILSAMPVAMGLVLWGSVELLDFAGIHAPTYKLAAEGGSETMPASQQFEGMIVKMDKAKHEIILKHWALGATAGAANAPASQYRLNHDPSFEVLKVGDHVEFLADQVGGVWTITQIQKK